MSTVVFEITSYDMFKGQDVCLLCHISLLQAYNIVL